MHIDSQINLAVEMCVANGIQHSILEDENTGVVTGFLFVTHEMLHQFLRNGDVIVADATHGTNVFGFPALSLVVSDQHFKSRAVCCVLLKHKGHGDYLWALNEFRDIVNRADAECWSQSRVVMADGEKALHSAFQEAMPGVTLLRCVMHVEQNLRHAMQKKCQGLGAAGIEALITLNWKPMISASSRSAYERLKAAVLLTWCEYVDLVVYLNEHIFINEEQFVPCLNDKLTLGMISSQRVEGWHKDMKTTINRRKPLINLIERVRQLSVDRDMAAARFELLATGDRAEQATEERNNVTIMRTNESETSFFLSPWSAQSVMKQVALVLSYDAVVQPDGVVLVYFRNIPDQPPKVVTVQIDSMSCSCLYPQHNGLPCRHVLAANNVVLKNRERGVTFIETQCKQRWLSAFMPTVRSLSPYQVAAGIELVAPISETIVAVRSGDGYQSMDDLRAELMNMMHTCAAAMSKAPLLRQTFMDAMFKLTEATQVKAALLKLSKRMITSYVDHTVAQNQRQKRLPSNGEKKKKSIRGGGNKRKTQTENKDVQKNAKRAKKTKDTEQQVQESKSENDDDERKAI